MLYALPGCCMYAVPGGGEGDNGEGGGEGGDGKGVNGVRKWAK